VNAAKNPKATSRRLATANLKRPVLNIDTEPHAKNYRINTIAPAIHFVQKKKGAAKLPFFDFSIWMSR
jgi:hypothetical protein